MKINDTPILLDSERSILRRVLSNFADRIDHAAIFGSRALGRAHAASDIDLVLYGPLDDAAVARIWTMLDESGLAVTVDVARYEGLGRSSLRRHIDAYALPLFDRDELLAAREATSRVA